MFNSGSSKQLSGQTEGISDGKEKNTGKHNKR